MIARLRLAILLAGLALLVGGCQPSRLPSAPHILTYASPYPPTHPLSVADLAWMESVQRRSKGEIGFRTFWSGSLLSSDMSIEELRRGIADVSLITPIYARGGTHFIRAQSGFYVGIATLEDQVRIYHCAAAQFPAYGDELKGIEVLAVQGGNFPGIITRTRPIRTLDDLKGLRLRVPGEAVAPLRRLGVDPVNLPMGDVYSALAKGVIDGVVAPADTLRSLQFAEVAGHFSPIRFSRGGYPARAISDRAMARLPARLQQILRDTGAAWEQRMLDELRKAEEMGSTHGRANGVSFTRFDPDDQKRFDAIYRREAQREARLLEAQGVDAVPVYVAIQRWITTPRTGSGQRQGCDPDPHPTDSFNQSRGKL